MGKKSEKKLTPKEFRARMAGIRKAHFDDTETLHAEADTLLSETLRKLGYEDGCDIYDNLPKWYA